MQDSEIINISKIIIIVGEAKVIRQLFESVVEVLVQETETDQLLLICIGHQTNIMQESNKKLKHHVFICLTSLINKMMQPNIITKKLKSLVIPSLASVDLQAHLDALIFLVLSVWNFIFASRSVKTIA
mgnify:CR=1 FL=1